MARFCICWLACCSLLLPFSARAAAPPISAEFFLQSIEPRPSATMLHDFLDIYGSSFAECKDTDTYLRALAYLADNGDDATVLKRLALLERCTNLSEAARERIAELRKQTAPTFPKPLVKAVAPAPVAPAVRAPVASAPVPPAPVPPAPESSVPEKNTPETTAPVESSPAVVVVQPQTSPSVTPPVVEPAPVQSASVQPAPDVTQAPTQLADVSAPTVTTPVTTPPAAAPSPKHTRKRSVRRTSLPVSPTIPMPSRTVPPTVLVQPAPSAPAMPPLPTTEPVPAPVPVWRTEVASRTVYRTGNEGTSRLLRLENTATLGYGNWTASATALYLNAGTAGNNEFAGSFFRDSQQRALLTEQTAFIPQIAYDGDTVDFSLGSSPLGGEVSPLPAFRLSYTHKQLKLAVFQESITDSLLSYVGFRDPFTGQRMGRVMKAGTRISWDDTIDENWFYGGAATGAYVYGENVKDNTQIRGEFYFGRSFSGNAFGNMAVGSYSAVDHYRTNLNNYTFGHGGYYSPYIAATSVLFVSWEYAGKLGRIKADVSSGFLYEKTRDSNQYYGTDGPRAVYAGETHRRLTVNAGLEGSLNLSEDLSLDSSVRVIHSGDFSELRGALYIKWTF